MNKDTSRWIRGKESSRQAEVLSDLCYQFVRPLLRQLYEKMDRRLVQKLLDLMMVIVMHRHRNHGLLLSELGGYLMGAGQAPAGPKRTSNLIRSESWGQREIESYLWEQGDQALEQHLSPQEEVYVIWDESVLEKPESLKAERLCAVCESDRFNARLIDAAIVADHLILAAANLGLGTCWIAAFDVKAAREVRKLPAEAEPVIFTPLGYLADIPGPKIRKPLTELVRYEHW
jgi:hypothetical protein